MKVALDYFKPSGGEFDSKGQWLFEIVHEVAALKTEGRLPGLMEGHSNFSVLIFVEDQGKHMLWGEVSP